ncbi:hypothetical protein [Streptomyces monashensis]|nr:hypothetical protein [Streptomyces monashensis]
MTEEDADEAQVQAPVEAVCARRPELFGEVGVGGGQVGTGRRWPAAAVW